MDEMWIYAAIAVIAVLVIALIAWAVMKNRRSKALRERFGPEYDQALAERGGKRRGEAELQQRLERVDQLELRPLSAGDRERFSERWVTVQSTFVDNPPRAVDEADALITEVMAARGYPDGSFEQRSADVSVMYPNLVSNYRSARALHLAAHDGSASTEDLRIGFVYYRDLFAELVETDPVASTHGTLRPQRA